MRARTLGLVAVVLGSLALETPGHALPSGSVADDIYVMTADGSTRTALVAGPADDDDPAWSPDGRLAFTSNGDGDYDIYVMNPGGQIVQLTNDPGNDMSPAWSHDGRRIAFVSTRAGSPDIHVMNADGSGVVAVTRAPGQELHPTWEPNGQRIAFTGYTETLRIHAINADGTNEVRLTGGGTNANPAWSPDGTKIAFSGNGITVMNPDGSAQTQLTKSGGAPEWSPDNSRILFVRSPDGIEFDLYVMPADGSQEPSPLGDRTGHVGHPAWSFDGKWIAFPYHAND
jgi:Tol biopolymer transport system component